MHVLVTGAGGFSGSEVTQALLARGHRVTAVVGSTRGRLPEEVGQFGEVELITGDLSTDLMLPDKVDAVVHTAARPLSPHCTVNDLVRDNVLATQKLVLWSRRSGVQKFIYFSSLSVYGQIEVPLVDETTPILNPDIYGLTKLIGEKLLIVAENTFCSMIIRLPGILGRDSVRNWMTQVLHAAREGREIVVFNPNAPFNNAVHISDLAGFVAALLAMEWRNSDVLILGAAGQMTAADAVRLVVDAFGGRSRVRYEAAPKPSFLISSARARAQYGYNPMEISDMLRRFSMENAPMDVMDIVELCT